MRSGSLLSFLLLSVSFPALAAISQKTPSSAMTDWHVAPMATQGDASASYCAMASHYTNGPIVTYTRNAKGKGSIAVDFANAELEKGKRYAVSLQTDILSQRFTATAISRTQLVLQIGLNKKLNDSLDAGHDLVVSLEGTDGTYTLAGNKRAFFEFDHCLKALAPTQDNQSVASAPVAPAPLKPQPIAEETLEVAQIESAPFIPAPVEMAQPFAAQAAPEPTPVASPAPMTDVSSILWDTPQAKRPASASTAEATQFDVMPSIPETPVSAAPLSLLPAEKGAPDQHASPEDVQKDALAEFLDTEDVAATIPAAGLEEQPAHVAWNDTTQAEQNQAEQTQAEQTKKRLKSTLAQARAEASGQSFDDDALVPSSASPTLVPATIFTPSAPKADIEKQATEKVETAKTIAQKTPEAHAIAAPVAAAPVVLPPVLPAPVATPTPVSEPIVATAAQAERVPLGSINDVASENEIHSLLFDNTPTLPKGASNAMPKAPPAASSRPTPEPIKQEMPKPVLPPVTATPQKPIEKKPIAPQETPRFEAREVEPSQDVIPSLPPAMPPALAPTLAVEKETPGKVANKTETKSPNVPSDLNTVTPSMGHPATKPFTEETQIYSAAVKRRRIVTFTPAPAAAIGAWSSRKVDATSKQATDGFCLMENKFDNDTKLMIGQRGDGYSTLGLNYGIDMLSPGKNYRVTVKVDGEFDEDFTGYAESSRTLIVQMGKKRSFFDALPQAQAMNVAMPGAASSFTLDQLSKALDEFSACLVGLGGNALNAAAAMPVAPVNPAVVPNDPVQSVALDAPVKNTPAKNVPVAKPIPLEEKPQTASPKARVEKYEVTEKTYRPVQSVRTEKNKPLPASSILWDSASAFSVPQNITAAVQSASDWTKTIRRFLKQADVQEDISVQDGEATWTDGILNGKAFTVAQTDMLDASDAALTKAEKSCEGEFSSQVGLPETYGAANAQLMESTCDKNGNVTVTTWLVQQSGTADPVTAIQVEAPRDQRGRAFRLRDKMISLLKKGDAPQATTGKPSSDKIS